MPSDDLDKIKESIKSNFEMNIDSFGKIHVTGGGSVKYSNDLNQLFGKFLAFDEMDSTVKGAFFVLNKFKSEKTIQPKYPVILANVGTGASFIFIDENKKFKRIGGTNIAGGTLEGICSLAKKNNSSVTLSSLIESGNSRNADILVKDIYGNDYHAVGLDGNVVAGSLGKVNNYYGTNLSGDVCASSAYMVCSNLVHLIYLYASVYGALTVMFSGSFVVIPAISNLLRKIAEVKFSGNIESHILDFGGYLGCFGIASELLAE